MGKFKKLEVTSADYEIIRTNKIESNCIVSEQIHGSRKSLFDGNNKVIATTINANTIALGELTKESFISFLGTFQKNLYKNFNHHPSLWTKIVSFKGVSRDKNKNAWNELKKGQFFYNIDLNSAYWQMAFKLGYIDEELYLKYLNDDSYKGAKRLCVSFLARQNKKNYYFQNDVFTVYCDNGIFNQVYVNIRNSCYQIIDTCKQECNYLAYNIDSIYVLPEDAKKIQAILNDNGFHFKRTLCQKISKTEYVFGKQVRKF